MRQGQAVHRREEGAEPGAAARALAARARRSLALGEHDAALEALDEAVRLCAPGSHGAAVRRWGADHVEAAAGAGDGDRARERVAALTACATEDDDPALDVLAQRAAGIVAREADMDLPFQEALALHDEVPGRLERGRTHLAYGERLVTAGRAGEASEQLAAALVLFESLGAEAWAARCRAALMRG